MCENRHPPKVGSAQGQQKKIPLLSGDDEEAPHLPTCVCVAILYTNYKYIYIHNKNNTQ